METNVCGMLERRVCNYCQRSFQGSKLHFQNGLFGFTLKHVPLMNAFSARSCNNKLFKNAMKLYIDGQFHGGKITNQKYRRKIGVYNLMEMNIWPLLVRINCSTRSFVRIIMFYLKKTHHPTIVQVKEACDSVVVPSKI